MSTNTPFDLIVVGGGPGGYVAAIRGAQLGFRVALVEKEAQLGGTCLRVGCIPSKALLQSSHLYHMAHEELGAHGIEVSGAKLDLGTMLGRKDRVVDTLAKGVEGLLKKNKIERFIGTGTFVSPTSIQVSADGGESQTLEGKKVIIATGSKVAPLRGIDFDGDRIVTSSEALSFESVPEKLVVIGAGAIGLELGSVWSRLGSQVTVLEYLDRILPGMDDELATQALKVFQKQGLTFQLGARVTGASVSNDKVKVTVDGADAIEADKVLVAVGRAPNTEGLGAEAIGLQLDERGRIPVDAEFQTNVPGVYAIGDVIPGPMLAHKAEEDGVALVEKLATGYGHVDYNLVPAIVYTHPEIASVGQTEAQLKEAGIPYNKGAFPMAANGRAIANGDTTGSVKILAHKETDRVLGVHILAANAGDLIAEAGASMAFGASAEDIARVTHAHPTTAETLKEAAMGVAGRRIHM